MTIQNDTNWDRRIMLNILLHIGDRRIMSNILPHIGDSRVMPIYYQIFN